MVNEVYIIDDDESSILIFRELFRNDKEYKFISVKTEQIDIALKNIPSLIVIFYKEASRWRLSLLYSKKFDKTSYNK